MPTLEEQFEHRLLPSFYEKDTHVEIQNLQIESIRVLDGETAEDDITVISYEDSPNLSFYDHQGNLVDVDHYLPDEYHNADLKSTSSIISNLKNTDSKDLSQKNKLEELLNELELAKNSLCSALLDQHGLEANRQTDSKYYEHIEFKGKKANLTAFLKKKYSDYKTFLEEYLIVLQKYSAGYVHFTPSDNIIITALNKNSGISVIIETQDVNGHLLSPNKWIITRTFSKENFQQSLVFRTEDVKAYFRADGNDFAFETERYKMYHEDDSLSIDSYLDNTDNLLHVPLIQDCYQILAVDNNILIALSNGRELTVVNTHKSVVPQKWPLKVVLPKNAIWMRVDENLAVAFIQDDDGLIYAIDISGARTTTIRSLGTYQRKFEIDQQGSIIAVNTTGELIRISTNVNQLVLDENRQNFAVIFKDISHLFKGESLFTRTTFAKPIEDKVESKELITDLDSARFDFETNIEHLILKCGNDFDQLLEVQEKVTLARQNICDEIVKAAEKAEVFLVGQRLQATVNKIVRPTQRRLRTLIESTRADWIIDKCRSFTNEVNAMSNPSVYHEILHNIRQFDIELSVMSDDNRDKVINEFRIIQNELGALFSDQMSRDGASLKAFISQEIDEIEKAIEETHEARQLESLLSTHPSAIELFSLLKQPYILQHIHEFKTFSPAEIQSRLFKAIQTRKTALRAEIEKKEKSEQAAKLQLKKMIEKGILFFVQNHSKGFSDVELSTNVNYQNILSDILSLERNFGDVRIAMELRRNLEKRIIQRNREDLERMIAFEGKYAYINNDPDLYVDLESAIVSNPRWEIDMIEKKGADGIYMVNFIRDVDRQVYKPSTLENLKANKAFEINESEFADFSEAYDLYTQKKYSFELLQASYSVHQEEQELSAFPQFTDAEIRDLLPKELVIEKALRCAVEKKKRDHEERTRERNVPKIAVDFIDETPYFQSKLQEFLIKAKVQLASGAGIILLSGPPSTGKSAFLKFAAGLMNREYFEHASDKWQTKNSLVTAIKFGEYGPYSIPAGFTKAITTPHALINIEEIKEWPEALRKSLNPFFAGSTYFLGPDGTQYKIGQNILLCAAANLGSMYRQDDEPFTADFWSRVEVIEYNYAPLEVSEKYIKSLFNKDNRKHLTIQDVAHDYFELEAAPVAAKDKAKFLSRAFLEFILLPKADEKVKREKLQNQIRRFFTKTAKVGSFSPEEAAKIALKRLRILQGYDLSQFYDFYNHFVNGKPFKNDALSRMQSGNVAKFANLKTIFHTLAYTESCLRALREEFYKTAGQSEIEGTNRAFIQSVHLLNLLGKF